jgi:hypothetical protein
VRSEDRARGKEEGARKEEPSPYTTKRATKQTVRSKAERTVSKGPWTPNVVEVVRYNENRLPGFNTDPATYWLGDFRPVSWFFVSQSPRW